MALAVDPTSRDHVLGGRADSQPLLAGRPGRAHRARLLPAVGQRQISVARHRTTSERECHHGDDEIWKTGAPDATFLYTSGGPLGPGGQMTAVPLGHEPAGEID